MLYRLNFGNGQVSEAFKTKREAQRARTEQVEYSARIKQGGAEPRIDFQDPDTGDWFSCGNG